MRTYEVTLKRVTGNLVQDMRQRRETVRANNEAEAKAEALSMNDNQRYFVVASVKVK